MKLQKNHRRLIYALITALALTALIGCPTDTDDSVSVSERINLWESAINAGAADAGSHLHPDELGYDQAQHPDFWKTSFGNPPYSVGEPVETTTNNVYESTITGGNFYYTGDKLVFTMREDGTKNWKIVRLVRNFSGTVDQVFPPTP